MDSAESKRTRLFICLALAIITCAVYCRVGWFDFVNYDDPDYVLQNNPVKSGLSLDGIVWAFTHFHAGNWHPVTWISHMLDCQIFGLNPGPQHWINVLLHAANAILLFLLLQRLTGALWRSAIVAGLFAVHPLHVESVAWISERKNVLSTFFGLLALIAYVRYVRESNADESRSSKSKKWYRWPLVLFALSLMSKPMLVTLPFVMLLLDYWPLQRVPNIGWRSFALPQFVKLIREKKWWFTLTAASCVVTFFAQKSGGAIMSSDHFPFGLRIANAINSYVDYIVKALHPVNLAVFYPLRAQPLWHLLAAAVALLMISISAILSARRFPFFLVGWLWFLGTLVPVIGFIQVGGQGMADRYMYVPLIGLLIAVVWGIAELLRRVKAPAAIGGTVAAGVMIAFAGISFWQLPFWQNSLTLFSHALEVTHDNAPANNNLGTALATQGRLDEALAHYAEAVRIDPGNASFQGNLATALLRAGQRDAAIAHYHDALRDNPNFAEAYSNLGEIFLSEHQVDQALTNFEAAVRANPESAGMRNNLANALLAAGKMDDALAQYLTAVRLDPSDATIRLDTGLALLKAGHYADAKTQFAEAVRLDPSLAPAHFELGRLLFLQKQFLAALNELGDAVKIQPNYPSAEFYESAAFAEIGQYDAAIAAADHALASAQQAGETNLAAHIQEALQSYKSQRPYRPAAPKAD